MVFFKLLWNIPPFLYPHLHDCFIYISSDKGALQFTIDRTKTHYQSYNSRMEPNGLGLSFPTSSFLYPNPNCIKSTELSLGILKLRKIPFNSYSENFEAINCIKTDVGIALYSIRKNKRAIMTNFFLRFLLLV